MKCMLADVDQTLVSQSISFLYAQASELLRRRRERREAGSGADGEKMEVALPAELGGDSVRVDVDFEVLDQVHSELVELTTLLSRYVEGLEEPGARLGVRLDEAERLRALIEESIGEMITFPGEPRDPTGTRILRGHVQAQVIHGTATGVDSESGDNASLVEGTVQADTVAPGASVSGVKIRNGRTR